MLSDKQSLILCGILGVGIFISGLLNILNHAVVLVVLILVFIAIIANIIITHSTPNKK